MKKFFTTRLVFTAHLDRILESFIASLGKKPVKKRRARKPRR